MPESGLQSVCVFCGSSSGLDPVYCAAAVELGMTLAREKVTLIYGGGNVGLMGALCDATLAAGGRVVGVIPRFLARKEVAHGGFAELHIVESMHERKAMMATLSSAFVAMPGGLGTLEAILEVVTWAQLGIHDKPCAFLNVGGYFDTLFKFLDSAVEAQLMDRAHREMIIVENEVSNLLPRLRDYRHPHLEKWINMRQT